MNHTKLSHPASSRPVGLLVVMRILRSIVVHASQAHHLQGPIDATMWRVMSLGQIFVVDVAEMATPRIPPKLG